MSTRPGSALITYGALVADDAEFVARAARIAALSLRLNDAPAAVDWLRRAERTKPDRRAGCSPRSPTPRSAPASATPRAPPSRAVSTAIPANNALTLLARRLR